MGHFSGAIVFDGFEFVRVAVFFLQFITTVLVEVAYLFNFDFLVIL
jgi:hypothetical protein